jgi:hypothetical protein
MASEWEFKILTKPIEIALERVKSFNRLRVIERAACEIKLKQVLSLIWREFGKFFHNVTLGLIPVRLRRLGSATGPFAGIVQ